MAEPSDFKMFSAMRDDPVRIDRRALEPLWELEAQLTRKKDVTLAVDQLEQLDLTGPIDLWQAARDAWEQVPALTRAELLQAGYGPPILMQNRQQLLRDRKLSAENREQLMNSWDLAGFTTTDPKDRRIILFADELNPNNVASVGGAVRYQVGITLDTSRGEALGAKLVRLGGKDALKRTVDIAGQKFEFRGAPGGMTMSWFHDDFHRLYKQCAESIPPADMIQLAQSPLKPYLSWNLSRMPQGKESVSVYRGGAEMMYAETYAIALGGGADADADPLIQKYFAPLIDYMRLRNPGNPLAVSPDQSLPF